MTRWSPFRSIIFVYIGIILTGTILLLLPQSSYGISFIDALFTSTSAVCVTGLIVKNTALDFTLTGKCIILFLIQIGGLGYMVFATLFMKIIGFKLDIKKDLIVKEEFGLLDMSNIPKFLRLVILTTLTFELGGVILLFTGFSQAGYPPNEAISHAVFHSVSAFCNAGFSSFSGNLANFGNSPLIVWTVPFLFIIGGLGFIVLENISERIKGLRNHLSEHTRIVLFTTMFLILIGTIIIFVVEDGNKLSHLSLMRKITISFFTATTPRTAGFSLINIAELLPTTLILLIIFMFIGASPGGTGGGIKTTTFVIINAYIISKLRGKQTVNVEKRRISEEQLNKALTLFFISLTLIVFMISIISFSERKIVEERGVLPIVFEELSAFGTVGLSMGSSRLPNLSLSHDFSPIGKLILMLTMIAGRAGPLSIAATVLGRKGREAVKHPLAKVQVG